MDVAGNGGGTEQVGSNVNIRDGAYRGRDRGQGWETRRRRKWEGSSKAVQGVQVLAGNGCKSGSRCWILEGSSNGLQGSSNQFCGGWARHGNVGGAPDKGVRDAFGTCGGDPDAVAAITVHGRADIPAIKRVRAPGTTLGGWDMDLDTDARWGNRSAVEVNRAKDLCMCRELGVKTGGAHEVKRHLGLGYKAVPEMHGEICISAA